jgi:histidyl-tRNA synthetase
VRDQAINVLASRLEQFMARYSYEKIETPIIQPAELFLTKAGDQIIHRLFTFERFGRQLALRPEFTALAAHAYNTLYPDNQPVIRWQFGGAVFEDASGETQRFSIGAELIGMGGAPAEAEIIALAANGAAERGLHGGKLVIGHVELMRVLLDHFHLDSRTQRFLLNHLPSLKQHGKQHILEQLDKLLLGRNDSETLTSETSSELSTQQMLDVLLDATQRGATMGGRTRQDVARRLLHKHQRATERGQIIAALDFLETWSAISAAPHDAFMKIEWMIGADDAKARSILDEWRTVITLLGEYGIAADKIEIQPSLARSWDYYTGIVFELWSADGHHLGGGGRYDELTRLIGGERDIPAVGFAYYVDELLSVLPVPEQESRTVVTISATRETYPTAIRWAQTLREHGYSVALLDEGMDAAEPLLRTDEFNVHWGNQIFTTPDTLLNALEREAAQ